MAEENPSPFGVRNSERTLMTISSAAGDRKFTPRRLCCREDPSKNHLSCRGCGAGVSGGSSSLALSEQLRIDR